VGGKITKVLSFSASSSMTIEGPGESGYDRIVQIVEKGGHIMSAFFDAAFQGIA